MLNLNTFLNYNARNYPHKQAFIQGDNSMTFEELESSVNKVANGLTSMGIMPGDKIALSCPNLFYFPIIYYAILKTGAAIVPLSILLRPNEIALQLTHSESKAFFCFKDTPGLPMGTWGFEGFSQAESCKHFITIPTGSSATQPFENSISYFHLIQGQSDVYECYPTLETDTAVILYTSGTTGDPKGVEISHSAIVWNAQAAFNTFRGTQNDILLTALPLFHSFGQGCNMNCSIIGGMTNILMLKFDPVAALKEMHKHKVTILTAVPTMYWQLVQSGKTEETKALLPEIRQNLRLCGGGAAKVPPQISKDFYEMFGMKIYEGMGISESSGIVSLCSVDKEPVLGSIGVPIQGTEFKIIKEDGSDTEVNEIGELCFRGVSAMKEYYKNPEATQEVMLANGWIRSGDVGYVDETGNYFLVDRIKDLIIRGGRNIYPKEVEEVIMTHPAISMVAVIGIPDDKYGEEVKAYAVLKQGMAVTEAELMQWTKENIAGYKYPRYIQLVETLPMTASGKISKKDLKTLHKDTVNNN